MLVFRALMLPSVIGPYRIVRLLGEGGMGVVYEAFHETIERRVALKVLLPEYARDHEALNRFFNEARAVNRIEHPSLVQISDFGQGADGTAYMVMEYLHGETLTARLARLQDQGQLLPLGEALQISAHISDALAAAHAKSIVHRDLKPGNVMLVPDPVSPSGERAKILDFGIAKLVQQKGKGTTNTRAIIGTPQYMSPEQCRGAGEVDHKSDVYALGVMLYEMLSGQLPFLGEGHGDFIGQHLFKEPPPLRQSAAKIPPDVARMVHRLLAKDRSQRPEMREVGAELSQLIAGISGRIFVPAARRRVEVADREDFSSLGKSLSQLLRSVNRKKRRARVAAAALAIALVASAALYGLGRYVFWRASPAVPTASVSPLAASPRPKPAGNPAHAPEASQPKPGPTPPPTSTPTAGEPTPAAIKTAPISPPAARPARSVLAGKPQLATPPKPAPSKLDPASSRKAIVEYED